MTPFYPQTGSADEWNAAYYRLEDYFRAHQVTDKVHQSQMILHLLRRAASRHALAPDQAPTRLALEEAYAAIDRWFAYLLPDEPPQRAAIAGRVSMHIIRATENWPHVFLAEAAEIPVDFVQALREINVQSGPDLSISSMVPRPLDVSPVTELVEETWERLGRWALVLLMGIIGLSAGAVMYFAQ